MNNNNLYWKWFLLFHVVQYAQLPVRGVCLCVCADTWMGVNVEWERLVKLPLLINARGTGVGLQGTTTAEHLVVISTTRLVFII